MEDVEVEKVHRLENHQHEAEFIAHQLYRASPHRDLVAGAQGPNNVADIDEIEADHQQDG